MREMSNTTRDVARELARKYSTMTHDELDILESVLIPRKYASQKEKYAPVLSISIKDCSGSSI